MSEAKKTNVSNKISLLLLIVLGLLLSLDVLTQFILKNITNLQKIGIYIIIFIIPIIIYLKSNRYKAGAVLKIKHFKLRHFPFVSFLGISVSIVCAMLNALSALALSRFGLSANVTSTVSFSSDNPVVTTVACVLMPALCEELLIRGVALTEYGKYGVSVSIIMTSVIFALFHGSPVTMLSLFVAGVIYAVITYLFKSVWPAFICHFINNAIAVYIGFNIDFIGYLVTDVLFIILIITAVFVVFYVTLKLGESVADELSDKQRLKTDRRKLVYGDPLKSIYIWLFLAISIYICVRRFI